MFDTRGYSKICQNKARQNIPEYEFGGLLMVLKTMIARLFAVLRSTPAPAFDILPMFTCTLQMLAKVEQGVTTNPLGSSRWAIEISHGCQKNSRRSGRLKWSCCTCDHGSSVSQINIIVRTEVGSTLQNQEWRLKTKKRGINVSFESQSWCAAQLFFQMLTCPCWYQEFMARKHDSL